MVSGKNGALEEFTIEQLEEAIVAKRKERIGELRAKRSELASALRKIENEIAAITGSPERTRATPTSPASEHEAPRRRRRGRGKGPSMGSLVLGALAAAGAKETSMSELTDALKGHTSSTKPNIIISQSLIRLKKDGLVESAGRGLYKATAAGRKQAHEG